MKKHANKQPVDDLFARKLENMSLPPSSDGFARLQARMGHPQPERRTVFWRNPTIQQYMAIAACILLCLFGWLYLSTEMTTADKTAVAVNKSVKLPVPEASEQSNVQPREQVAINQPISPSGITGQTNPKTTDSVLSKTGKRASDKFRPNDQELARFDQSRHQSKGELQNQSAVGAALEKELGTTVDLKAAPVESITEKQVATALSKPAAIAERVLIVTIAEPEALVSARQAATAPTDGKVIIAANSKPAPEARASSIWQQVKRLKQGEVFARKDAVDDERGLIGRAYNGLKQTLDKDKLVKQ